MAARLMGLAALLTSPLRVSAQVVPYPIRVVSQDMAITFANTKALDSGWVEAMTANGQALDTAFLKVCVTVPVTVTYSAGSDMYQAQSGYRMPLQFAARVQGAGTWGSGPFSTGSGWSGWGPWQNANVASSVSFNAKQTFGIELMARTQRSGMKDPAGLYQQHVPLTITLSF